jgi:hypothetical protein
MEQLRIKADWFRKQGRLQDDDLEEIITKIKTDEEFKEGEENSKAASGSKDKQKRVLEAVEEGLLQVHGFEHKVARNHLDHGGKLQQFQQQTGGEREEHKSTWH